MDDESLEDTYAWLDTDENYPLDPLHHFAWRPWGTGDTDWLSPWCEEHDVCVRDQKTAHRHETSSEEQREWITENRDRLVKKCLEGQKIKAARTQWQTKPQNPTWPQTTQTGP